MEKCPFKFLEKQNIINYFIICAEPWIDHESKEYKAQNKVIPGVSGECVAFL